jgi:hypothetical protein
MLRSSVVAAVLLSGLTMAGVSHAEEEDQAAATEAPATASTASTASTANSAVIATPEPATQGHASGLMVQARVQSQSSLFSLAGGGTGFLVGYQGPSYALGLGLGLARIGVDSGGQSASLTLFQVAPTAIIDVWHSADGRARANLIGSVGYARASLDATVKTTDCVPNAAGMEVCTDSTQDGSVNATLIPVMLGFGGDYFLSRNFALGAEFGVQAMFLASASADSGSTSQSVDAGANAQFAYGALRATFVLGD